MRAVYAFHAESFPAALAATNVLVSRGAKIISVAPGAEYEIWFEHECALEPEWLASVCREARSHPAMSVKG
jgi:hypothetical protein